MDKKPICKKCLKGHEVGVVNEVHGDGTISITTSDGKSKDVPHSQISRAPPPGTCPSRDEFLSFIRASADDESDTDSDMPELEPIPQKKEEEWQPVTPRHLWNLYKMWQTTAGMQFPTQMGMTGEQLGDIMQNYGKYAEYYN